MNKLDTAKDILMSAANDNPAATFCISIVNGQTKFGAFYTGVNDLLLMKWAINYEIEKAILKGFGINELKEIEKK